MQFSCHNQGTVLGGSAKTSTNLQRPNKETINMRKIASLIALATALVPMFVGTAKAERREGIEVSKAAQAVDFTQSIDMSGYASFSAQAVYSDGTPSAAFSATSGKKSTATLTVVRNDVGTAKRADLTITISSNGATALAGAVVTLNGKTFTAGSDWTVGSSSVASAKSLSDAIDATEQYRATYTFSGAQTWAVITASVTETGTLGNGYAASVSTSAITLSRSTFLGGEANGVIHIGTVTLTQGVDWTDGATTALTAKAISDAIMANMASIVVSTYASSVVYATSTINEATKYSIDGPSSLTVSQVFNGAASDISLADDTISTTSHRFTTGMAILYTTTTPNVSIGGLRDSVTYYAIRSDANTFALSDTSTGAVAGITLNLTTLPTITASTYTFTPIALATVAGSGFFWQASDDNTNFSTLSTVSYSSVTYAMPSGGSTIWDFGSYPYKYLRVNFKGPATGGIALTVRMYGKKD